MTGPSGLPISPELNRLTYSYEDMRTAFMSGFAASNEGEDVVEAWDSHREFMTATHPKTKPGDAA